MSSLSNRDFFIELGKGILIYPFNASNVKGASINLSVSNYAWNINTKKRLRIVEREGKKYIFIPPRTPVIISTLEAIYVSARICGTYHSKVSLSAKGLGYVSTTLDPEYFGTSLIGVTNNSDSDILLEIASTFVTVMFSYLQNQALQSVITRPNRFHQSDIIANYEDAPAFEADIRNKAFLNDPDSLGRTLNQDEKFLNWRTMFSQSDAELQREFAMNKKKQDMVKLVWKAIAGVVLYLVIFPMLMLFFIVMINQLSTWLTSVIFADNPSIDETKLFMPLVSAMFVSLVGSLVLILTKIIYPYIDRKVDEK